MRLTDKEWKEFRVKDLFGIKRGSITSLNEIDEGATPIVSASGDNEGIDFFGNVPALYNNNITISMNGVNTGFTAYHGYDFNINVDCCVLIQKFTMNAYIGEFIATIIGKLRCKYSYGRKMSAERIMKETIKLPVNSSGEPDWQFMEDYIKSLRYKPLTTKNKPGQAPDLKIDEWREFRIGDLFQLEPTKGVVTDDLIEGFDVPYMAAKHDENGIEMICSKDGVENWISEGNCIVFINLGAGSAGYANYIKENFIGMRGKTTCGYNLHLNEYNGLFIATCLCQERPKYSFGRSWTGDRLKDTIIKLPVDSSGNPDWQFMENYIKALPYGDRLQ